MKDQETGVDKHKHVLKVDLQRVKHYLNMCHGSQTDSPRGACKELEQTALLSVNMYKGQQTPGHAHSQGQKSQVGSRGGLLSKVLE